MAQSGLRLAVADYMAMPEGTRCQLLNGELLMAPAPVDKHQVLVLELAVALRQFVRERRLGQVRVSPYDVVLSEHDVVQPDLLFVSNQRLHIITAANIQGAPDLVIEVLSPSTAYLDLGYKRQLYSRSGVREYWLVDPIAETIEVLAAGEAGLAPRATYGRGETLASPLLPGLSIDLAELLG